MGDESTNSGTAITADHQRRLEEISLTIYEEEASENSQGWRRCSLIPLEDDETGYKLALVQVRLWRFAFLKRLVSPTDEPRRCRPQNPTLRFFGFLRTRYRLRLWAGQSGVKP
jgi:hypothetical protein